MTGIIGDFGVFEAPFIALLLALLLYFLPAFIAYKRHHLNRIAILILDLLLGWTFLGWVIALIWSLTSNTESGKHNVA